MLDLKFVRRLLKSTPVRGTSNTMIRVWTSESGKQSETSKASYGGSLDEKSNTATSIVMLVSKMSVPLE